MASYFDSADADDKNLLRSGFRSHADLTSVAELAEADAIEFYTERPPEILYTSRLGTTLDGLVTGATGRYEDVSSTGLSSNSTAPQRRVYLLGYKADANHVDVDPALRTALKRAIAEVINWRLTMLNRDAAVMSVSGDKKSVLYAANSQDSFPPDWNRRLTVFDSREGLIGL